MRSTRASSCSTGAARRWRSRRARRPTSDRCWSRTDGVVAIELRVADAEVGRLRCARGGRRTPGAAAASQHAHRRHEVERVRAPELASEEAAGDVRRARFWRARSAGREECSPPRASWACATSSAVPRPGPRALRRLRRGRLAHTAAGGRRARGARSVPRAVAVLRSAISTRAEVIVLLAGADEAAARRAAAARAPRARVRPGAASCSRSVAAGAPTIPCELRAPPTRRCWRRTSSRATRSTELAFEETGRLPAAAPYMSDPAELKRFYARPSGRSSPTTSSTRPTCWGRWRPSWTATRTSTRPRAPDHPPPHDPLPVRARARADRAGRQSSDGREKLSLGLKAMRVLGMGTASGPSTEPGHSGGRVPRR